MIKFKYNFILHIQIHQVGFQTEMIHKRLTGKLNKFKTGQFETCTVTEIRTVGK